MKKRLLIILLIGVIINIGLAGEGKISGKVYFDYAYDIDNGSNAFDIHRAYFTYSNKISDEFKVNFRTDVGRVEIPKTIDTTDGSVATDSKTQLFSYLKYAYAEWKSPIGKLKLGLQGMNMFNVQESTWGNRYIEKTAMDKNKWSSSADMGIAYINTFGKMINYSVLVTNGTGYKKVEDDKYKKISLQCVYGEINLSKKEGFNIGTVLSHEPTEDDPVIVMGAFAGFAGAGVTTGLEVNMKTDSDTSSNPTLISAYASYKLTKELLGFVRSDILNNDDAVTYILGGIAYSPVKSLNIAPNFRIISSDDDNSTEIYINIEYKF